MNQAPKSATTAGLLGIFLGAVGAHCWYLGDKKKGIIHVSLLGGGILLILIGGVVLPAIFVSSLSLAALSFVPIISGLGSAICAGNAIWGLVEGIIILTKGDNGLAAMGIPVANPQPYAQQPYGYPNQPMPGQPMGQPYPGQPMNQPMPGQPMPMQPMPGQPMPAQPMAQPYPGQPMPPMGQQPVAPQPVPPMPQPTETPVEPQNTNEEM